MGDQADMDEKEQQLRAQLEQVTSALSLKQAAVKQSNVKMTELQLRTAKEQTLQKSDVKPGKTAASRVLAPSSLTNKVDAPAQGCKKSTASATQKKSSSFLPDDFKSELAQIRSELKVQAPSYTRSEHPATHVASTQLQTQHPFSSVLD